MRIEDVPSGWLIVALQVDDKIFCRDCMGYSSGQALTENDVSGLRRFGVGVYCANCGHAFFSFPDDPPFIPLLNMCGFECSMNGCFNRASWLFTPIHPLCESCHTRYQACDMCPCCGMWYPACLTSCPSCGYVFNEVVVVPGLCEYRYPQRRYPPA